MMPRWLRKFFASPEPVLRESQQPTITADAALLGTLLEIERSRLESAATLELKRHELELKKAELELSELERIGTEKRKQAIFAAELKEQQREKAAKMREAKKQKALAGSQGQQLSFDCEECNALAQGRSPQHTADLIRHRREGHLARFTAQPNGVTH